MAVTIEDVCRSAWQATKSESAPNYDALEPDYRAKLTERAEGVLGGIYPAEPWLQFELTVCQLADGRGNMQVGSEILAPAVKAELIDEVEEENGDDGPDESPELIEPKGALPKDFPAHDKLYEGGIHTYTQLSKVEDLTEIAGIGPATAKQIQKRVKADRKALNKEANG